MTAPLNPPSGLALLSERRQEVLHAYLDLLPTLGRSLDGRTRELIRVAVHGFAGAHGELRCNVSRALAEGATIDEIVDAVTLALPEAGLSRISEALTVVAEFVQNTPESDRGAESASQPGRVGPSGRG